jgi:hypothetical protein
MVVSWSSARRHHDPTGGNGEPVDRKASAGEELERPDLVDNGGLR